MQPIRYALSTIAIVSLIAAFLVASPSCKPKKDDGGDTGGGDPVTCSYGGATYAAGTSFDADDGCNTCTCDAAGLIACTEIACGGACGDGSDPVCVQYGTIACDEWACFECGSDDECADDSWCRPTQEGGTECAPFVGPGESCQGFVLPWTRNKCEDGLMCVPKEATGDIPGTCASCNYNGTPYQAGDGFDADDGCNTCFCGADGLVACTKIGCPEPPSCHYFGEDYDAGESFPHYDGCNTCTCTEYGVVACTKIACTLCPPGVPMVACFAEPCAVDSCDVEGATCSNNYCGGCNAYWFDGSGNTVCE